MVVAGVSMVMLIVCVCIRRICVCVCVCVCIWTWTSCIPVITVCSRLHFVLFLVEFPCGCIAAQIFLFFYSSIFSTKEYVFAPGAVNMHYFVCQFLCVRYKCWLLQGDPPLDVLVPHSAAPPPQSDRCPQTLTCWCWPATRPHCRWSAGTCSAALAMWTTATDATLLTSEQLPQMQLYWQVSNCYRCNFTDKWATATDASLLTSEQLPQMQLYWQVSNCHRCNFTDNWATATYATLLTSEQLPQRAQYTLTS